MRELILARLVLVPTRKTTLECAALTISLLTFIMSSPWLGKLSPESACQLWAYSSVVEYVDGIDEVGVRFSLGPRKKPSAFAECFFLYSVRRIEPRGLRGRCPGDYGSAGSANVRYNGFA